MTAREYWAVDTVPTEIQDRFYSENLGGRGLKGIPGLNANELDALADFIVHSARDGRALESVGVFTYEPVAINFRTWKVDWKYRYIPLTNFWVGDGNRFEIWDQELEWVWRFANYRQDLFFEDAGVDPQRLKIFRYNVLTGIGHSHPGGTTTASVADLEAFTNWKAGQEQNAIPGRQTLGWHWIFGLGQVAQSLTRYSAENELHSVLTGDFTAAVQ